MEAGADPLLPTERGTTPLMMTAGAGTDVQRERANEERAMALETAKFLVERGADVNAAGQYGWTALHAAAYQGMNEIIEYLVSKGANDRSEGRVRADRVEHFAVRPHQGYRGAPPSDPAQVPGGNSHSSCSSLGAGTLDKTGVVVVLQRSGDLNLGNRVP